MAGIYTSLNKLNMNFLRASETRLADLSRQFCSDGQGVGYTGVKDIKVFLDQEVALPNMSNFIDNDKFAMTRLDFMTTRMESIMRMTSQLQKELILQRNDQMVPLQNLGTLVQDNLLQLTYLLNARFDGEYVFSGSSTNTPPVVDLSQLGAVLPGAAPDTTYYQGNLDTYSIRADDSQVVNCGVTAMDTGIEQLIRALRTCKGTMPGAANFDACIAAALDLCDSATSAQIDSESQIAEACSMIRDSADNLVIVQGSAEEAVKLLGYKEPSAVASEYFEQKIALSMSQQIVIQTFNTIQKLVESLPR